MLEPRKKGYKKSVLLTHIEAEFRELTAYEGYAEMTWKFDQITCWSSACLGQFFLYSKKEKKKSFECDLVVVEIGRNETAMARLKSTTTSLAPGWGVKFTRQGGYTREEWSARGNETNGDKFTPGKLEIPSLDSRSLFFFRFHILLKNAQKVEGAITKKCESICKI